MSTINVVFFVLRLLIYALRLFYATNELYICGSNISLSNE